MCIIAAKKFDGIGWVGAKNRDRNYIPTIRIKQSNRREIQRLYIDDVDTRYTEGLNEFGVCILFTSLKVMEDEDKIKESNKTSSETFMDPDGKKIRTALYEKTPKAAMEKLIEMELNGCIIAFSQDRCYVLEASSKVKDQRYVYKLEEVTDDHVVRTNHGIFFPEFGYDKNSEDAKARRSRESSEVRYSIVEKRIQRIYDPLKLLEILSIKENNDVYMNPIRLGDVKKKEMLTTGQILLVPHERTMHYRPIHSNVEFKYTRINSQDSKTFFEIVSNRKLLGFKEFSNITA